MKRKTFYKHRLSTDLVIECLRSIGTPKGEMVKVGYYVNGITGLHPTGVVEEILIPLDKLEEWIEIPVTR